MKKLIKKVGLSAVKTYFRARQMYPIWRMINRDAVRRFETPLLDGVQKRIAGDLATHGIAIAHIDELFPASLWTGIVAETETLWKTKGQAHKSKPFLEPLIDAGTLITMNSFFTKFALDQKIRDVVNTYLGMRTKYYYHTLNVTNPVSKGEKAQKSQRWHRDPEDKKVCKVFLYLSDVDETAGPFMYVVNSAFGMKYGGLFTQKPPIGYYPGDDLVEANTDPRDIHIMTGRRGTIIFCDTTGLHKGGYATEKQRLMFTAGFKSPSSITPLRIQYPESDLYELIPSSPMPFSSQLFRWHQRWSRYLGIDPYEE